MFPKLDDRTEYIYNHFIPQFYLHYFTISDKPNITNVTDLSRNVTYQKNIAKVGGEKYLNTVVYEKYLSKEYESKYAETIRKIQTIDTMAELGIQLSRGYMDDFFDFVAFMISHNFYYRQTIATAVSKSTSENLTEVLKIVCHKQDIIARQSLEFWTEELSKWMFFMRYSEDVPLNYITSDFPVILYSVSPDLLDMGSLTQNFSGALSFGHNEITNFPHINITDNNAALLMPVTNNTIIFGFKNQKTINNFRTRFSQVGHTKEFRSFANIATLYNATQVIYAKSKDEIAEMNKYLRGFYLQPDIKKHSTYDPFIDP